MLRLINTTRTSPLLRSVASVKLTTKLCGEKIFLFSEFINMLVIHIPSQTYLNFYTCFKICFAWYNKQTIFCISFINFHMCYRHALVRVVWAFSSCFESNILSPFLWVAVCLSWDCIFSPSSFIALHLASDTSVV